MLFIFSGHGDSETGNTGRNQILAECGRRVGMGHWEMQNSVKMNHYKDTIFTVMNHSDMHRILSGQKILNTREYFQSEISQQSRTLSTKHRRL